MSRKISWASQLRKIIMHHSRLCAVLIDCKTADLEEAAHFWAAALGRPVDLGHPMSRHNYRMLETRLDEVIIEIQQVEHESRAHIDIETDDKLGARVVNRLERWVVMQALQQNGYAAGSAPLNRLMIGRTLPKP
jgi:hypothetical protein